MKSTKMTQKERRLFYKLMAKYKKVKKHENLQRRARKTKEIPAGVL